MMIYYDVFFVWNSFDWAKELKLLFSSKTSQNTSGLRIWMMKINNISHLSDIKGITFHIAWLGAIYSSSVVIKAISICILLNHKKGHTVYVVTCPKRYITFLALLESSWSQTPENWYLHNIWCLFFYPDYKLRCVWIPTNYRLVDPYIST